jgi:hypothetical protein
MFKKPRKPRTTGRDMCPGCIAFGCDPMTMSRAFRRKVDARQAEGLCPACGRNPCRCKSKLLPSTRGTLRGSRRSSTIPRKP